MGASQSSHSAVTSHQQLLERLAGPEPVPFADAFWGQLLNLPMPLAAESPEHVEDTLIPHCRQLMVHNPITHNFQRLVLHALDLVSAAQGGKPSLAVANSLHIVSVVIKYIIETGSPSTLSMAFEASPGLPAAVQGGQLRPPSRQGTGRLPAECMHPTHARCGPTQTRLLTGCCIACASPYSHAGQQSLLPLFINRLVLLVCNLQPRCA